MRNGISQPYSPTNRLLGYPADARLLIVNADDFGMCHAVNAAIIGALTAGIVRSTSLMVPCPWMLHAVHFLADHPQTPFGVHLTAIGDGAVYRWGPVTASEKVRSLVDAGDPTGFRKAVGSARAHFYTFDRMTEFLAHVNLGELALEFRAQIESVLTAGLRPTHLDWHSLRIIGGRPDIHDVMFRLAREYGLALRVAGRSWIKTLQGRGFPTNDYDILDSYGLGAADKGTRYARLLRQLPAGLSEWAVHPGLDTPELLAIEPGDARIRQADYDFLTSQGAKDIIREEGIILLDYRALQAAWQEI